MLSVVKCRTGMIVMLASMTLGAGCVTQADKPEAPLAVATDEKVVTVEGVPGGITRRTAMLSAVVTAIDYKKRTVTLEGESGGLKRLDVGPEVVNFNQIKKGDHVNIRYLQEMVVYLKDIGAPNNDGAAAMAMRAKEGSKPAAVAGGTLEITAVVEAVDLDNHAATLKFPDGTSQVVPVREDVVLKKDQIGREVVIQRTTAVAVTVEAQ